MITLKTPQEMAADTAGRFRSLRRARKITIKQLSRDSGVPYSTIRRFESTGEIGFLALVKLASTLNEDDQITGLFRNQVPTSIEEVIRENRRQG